MNKRQFLQLLPLAAITATAMKIDNVEAQVHEVKPEKKYLIVIPDLQPEDGQRIAEGIRGRLGENVTVLAGAPTANMKVYELQ